ncbi:MAG: hypothetical protein RXR20_04690 [Paraburkholderia sp.]|jgi:hypothetical protein|uniref:hypothetical protein n=1 Tax=Burkholderiaceae TaxID=119060 RepID=UPI0010F9C886|nr:hypothetical protein [Burkholderia sp. 4M9327F10]
MDITLSILSKLCFAWVLVYLAFSLQSALWAGARHSSGLVILELQPHRARGKKEATRARLLRRMALLAVVALPLGIVATVVGLAIS